MGLVLKIDGVSNRLSKWADLETEAGRENLILGRGAERAETAPGAFAGRREDGSNGGRRLVAEGGVVLKDVRPRQPLDGSE